VYSGDNLIQWDGDNLEKFKWGFIVDGGLDYIDVLKDGIIYRLEGPIKIEKRGKFES
jgi:hypothetical protein